MESEPYSSVLGCPHCGHWSYDHEETERPATWWSVAVYEEGRAYGGPEEGGWWYTYGTLTMPNKQRVFESHAEAEAYAAKLWDEVNALNKELGTSCDYWYSVRKYTEQLPDTHYPKVRPHYW
jgi:hypothetical protein